MFYIFFQEKAQSLDKTQQYHVPTYDGQKSLVGDQSFQEAH